jgi:hypothetical protein
MAVSGKYLLDTNIVIALFAGEQSVLDHLRNAAEVYIPSVVIGSCITEHINPVRPVIISGGLKLLLPATSYWAVMLYPLFIMAISRSNYGKRVNLFQRMISG